MPKLLQQYQKLSHESFKQWMFKQGILPKPLATRRAPKCPSGYDGKASRRPWREKGLENWPQITETIEPHLIETVEEFKEGLPRQEYEQTESQLDNPTHELLQWHYKWGHEPFHHIQWMAISGVIPHRLANCRVPQCAACYYGKASRQPWREKGLANKNKIALVTAPGQIVSVDQMQSTAPGMVGQNKGIPMRQRYHYVTLSFVHLQKTSSGEETLDAKWTFEGFACSLNVQIQHYHADNGRFCETLWMNNVKGKGQTISFCRVNSHFQNGVAKRRISNLSDGARTSFMQVKERWSKATSVHLWPYAVRHRNDNSTRKESNAASPIEIVWNMTIRPRLKHFLAFGCPTYQLNRSLQGEKSQLKGKQRAHLGSSPKHASLVALVLDFLTAPVPLQFHLKFEDLFETFSPSRTNIQAQQSCRQHFDRVKKEPFRALESSVITPRQGDHIGRADLPVKLLIEHVPLTLQLPLPPDDTFGIDEDQRVTPEGAIQIPEHIPTPSIAVESVAARRSGCNR
jgi:hypothetical protein